MTTLTICTVSHTPKHKPLLEINWDLVKQLNTGASYTWILVENLPSEDTPTLGLDHIGFQLVRGPVRKDHKFGVCYHAAGGFMAALPQVQTRFLLILDPDLFVVRKNWINEVLAHMEKNQLTFFGAPWYPTLYHKWRYFPCPQFMMIDLARVDKANLNFMPRYELKYSLTVPAEKADVHNGHKSLLARVKNQLRVFLKRGSIINSSLDSGWQIYQNHKHDPKTYGWVQPVLKLHTKPLRPNWLNSHFNRWLERVLPDHWCYFPKQKNYLTTQGFKERGYFDADAYGWDETMFQDQPFSFHLRGMLVGAKTRDHNEEVPIVKKALASFL